MDDPTNGHMRHRDAGNDPIKAAWANSSSMTELFLKNGESLKPIQRAGIIVISLMIVGNGVYFAADALEGFQASSPRFLPAGLISLFLLVLGMLGLRNALRFRRRSSEE